MKLTVAVKLQPTPEQVTHVLATLEAANTAANQVSQQAWETQVFAQFKLHTLCYAAVRAASGLAAQVVVRLVAKGGRFALAADYNAALNLASRARAVVNPPMVCASSDATDKSLQF